MPGMNKVIVAGNVGKDPEIRSTQSGDRIANFTLATSERWTDKQTGEQHEKTEWHRVVIFNDRIVDVVEKYVKKGGKVIVEGKLATRKWTDQQGIERYSTEIVIDRFRGELHLMGDAPKAQPTSALKRSYASKDTADSLIPSGDLDDEIPF